MVFHPKALRDLRKLDPGSQKQIMKRLDSRLNQPLVPKARLAGVPANRYKIKLKSAGFRLVYKVDFETQTVRVLAVGRRDSDVYREATIRGATDS